MPSLLEQADSIRTAVSSCATCTAATVVLVREILATGLDTTVSTSTTTTKTGRPAAAARSKTQGSRTTTKKAGNGARDGLPASEKAALAVGIINSAIKALGAHASTQQSSRAASKGSHETKEASRRTSLRRSLSTGTPLSPKPRALNRTATQPTLSSKSSRTNLTAASSTTTCLATVECARVAFAALRGLADSGQISLPEYHLETSLLTFVEKLIKLEFQDQALRELRTLRRWLGLEERVKKGDDGQTTRKGLADLLVLQDANLAGRKLALVANLQLQVVRLLALYRKPQQTEDSLQYLADLYPASPLNMLSKISGDSSKNANKFDSLSNAIFTLAPSTSVAEDANAMEPRLHPSPTCSFQLQVLGLKARLKASSIRNSATSSGDDTLRPFSVILAALLRRTAATNEPVYSMSIAAFEELKTLSCNGTSQEDSPSSTYSCILQSLAMAARREGFFKDAVKWMTESKSLLDKEKDSVAKICLTSADLLALCLKEPPFGEDLSSLAKEVRDLLGSPLRGLDSEMEELLASLSRVRSAAVRLYLASSETSRSDVPADLVEGLQALVLYLPRFLRRWLGTPPSRESSPRDQIKYEQRRSSLKAYMGQTMESVLATAKRLLDDGSLDFDNLDAALQGCLGLLGDMDGIASAAPQSGAGHSFFVLISSLYYKYSAAIQRGQTKNAETTVLRALKRSVDSVVDRSCREKQQAQLTTKLERFAELCKEAGRTKEARDAFQSICSSMVEDKVLTNVASAMAEKPPVPAWELDGKVALLSRTLCAITKLDKTWNDWTFLLPELERAAVLEHLLCIIAPGSAGSCQPIRLTDPSAEALLRIYSPERFPVRRLRSLLHLLTMNSNDDRESGLIKAQIDVALRQCSAPDLGEDALLSGHIPHLQSYYDCVDGLSGANSTWPTPKVQEAISRWKTMVRNCRTKDDLFSVVDNPVALVTHLKSVADFASMKGESMLMLLVLEIVSDIASILSDSRGDLMVLHGSTLATRYINLGYSHKAGDVLERVKQSLRESVQVSKAATARFHITFAEHLLSTGSTEKADQHLAQAKSLIKSDSVRGDIPRSELKALVSLASSLLSKISFERGELHQSLSYIRHGSEILIRTWRKMEAAVCARNQTPAPAFDQSLQLSAPASDNLQAAGGPEFWVLAHPLLSSVLQLSTLYAHLGLYQETLYYAERAELIAASTGSPLHKSNVACWMAQIYLKASKPQQALRLVTLAREDLPQEPTPQLVKLTCDLSDIFREMDDAEAANELLDMAERTSKSLEANRSGRALPAPEEAEKAKATTRGRKTAVRARGARPTKASDKAAPKQAAESMARDLGDATASSEQANTRPALLLASVLISRALFHIHRKDWVAALKVIQEAKNLPKTTSVTSLEQVTAATCLIGQSLELMIKDPVFSVIPDSTISFPATAAGTSCDKASQELARTPPARGRAAASRSADAKSAKAGAVPHFIEALKQAQEYLLEAHSVAISNGEGSLVLRISTLLQSTAIILSATSTSTFRMLGIAGHATCAIELARNVTWRRERKAIMTEKLPRAADVEWPAQAAAHESARRSSVGFANDMAKFQRDHVEIIPKAWSVVSMSLSDNFRDLCVTKLKAGHTPLVLRIPLMKEAAEDDEGELMDFEWGRSTLGRLVERANETSHNARKFSSRSDWWHERQSLDAEMGEFLGKVEASWLCGFRGIFSQHQRRADLLARFQKSLHGILDKHLPSRRPTRGRRTAKMPKVTLDPRILDLFIGLGDPSGHDLHDALDDLLCFVVDVLQFHGERNAYDEIDFDAMVVETIDVLHSYHSMCRDAGAPEAGAHTILVLDKALSAFPWESLPCLRGLAVSRVPSLGCLRRLILERQPPQEAESNHPDGHFVSCKSGTYILDPGSDLVNTLSAFKQPFSSLGPSWTGVVSRPPSEDEFRTALSDDDIVLYFGHGSGAQYITSRTIRRLDKCRSTVLLMGCSSASLPDVGEFESHGPVRNYMLAGCPAVVGTLWDVTDKDIDRFAGRLFSEWGLLSAEPKSSPLSSSSSSPASSAGASSKSGKRKPGSGREQQPSSGHDENIYGGGASLVQAVAAARDVCNLRYLNGAAVCVYGIPVYIDQEA